MFEELTQRKLNKPTFLFVNVATIHSGFTKKVTYEETTLQTESWSELKTNIFNSLRVTRRPAKICMPRETVKYSNKTISNGSYCRNPDKGSYLTFHIYPSLFCRSVNYQLLQDSGTQAATLGKNHGYNFE